MPVLALAWRGGGASTARSVRRRQAQRPAAASTAAGGGKARNERGNLANATERGEHEHQWLT